MSFKDLSILIPTRNREQVLRRALQHMYKAGLADVHFMIYDDASEDPDSTIRASREVHNCEVILGTTCVGQAGGRNQLIQACKTNYCLLMDDDTWFRDLGSLKEVLERKMVYPGIGCATAVCFQVIRTYDGVHLFPPHMQVQRVLNFSAMGLLLNRRDILEVGGFRDFFCYRHEETELALRLWSRGYITVYDPSVVVEHCHTAAARNSYQYDFLSARNLILMHGLNFPGWHGMPEGILRAIRLISIQKYNKLATFLGIIAGVKDLHKYKNYKTVMSKEQYFRLKTFKRELKVAFCKAS